MSIIEKTHLSLACHGISKNKHAWIGAVEGKNIIAAPIHKMVIPTHVYSRLSDIPFEVLEESLNLAGKIATQLLLTKAKGCIIALNDGDAAKQTIAHTHFHVLGVDNQLIIDNLYNDTAKISKQHAPKPLYPLRTCITKCDSMEDVIKALYRLKFNTRHNDNKIGYSISMIIEPTQSVFGELVIEEWHSRAPKAFSLTNLLRVMHGYRDTPASHVTSHRPLYFQPKF